MIDLARIRSYALPEKRTIIIANVDLMYSSLMEVANLMSEDPSVHFRSFFMYEDELDAIDSDEIDHMINLIGFEEYLHELANTFYHRMTDDCEAYHKPRQPDR